MVNLSIDQALDGITLLIPNSVCRFITLDMHPNPYSTVNDPGFRHLLYVIEPRYILPDRKQQNLSQICIHEKE